PLVRAGQLAPAIAALEILVKTYPSRADERRLLASLFGRTEQWERAIAEADAAARIAPDAADLHAARIQLRVQAGRLADAAGIARATVDMAKRHPDQAYSWMLAFARNGDAAEAADIASDLAADQLPNER